MCDPILFFSVSYRFMTVTSVPVARSSVTIFHGTAAVSGSSTRVRLVGTVAECAFSHGLRFARALRHRAELRVN